MEQKSENTYSNIIAPSDGVRRFLCKTSVLVLGIIALVYSVCAFRMNSLEHSFSGGSLRTVMLYVAYVLFPIGVLAAAVCARIKKFGLAYSMIALLVAVVGCFMLFLNSLSALFREADMQGYLGGFFEMLAFGAALAVLVNLTLSCMNFRLLPIIGNIGMIAALLALIITGARIAIVYSSMQFAWNSNFDWGNLASQVSGDNLQHQANWIFRCITLDSFEAKEMFMLRFYERISACIFYSVLIVFSLKYKNSMARFNKLLVNAGEYVDIPQANLAESLAETEKIIGEKLKSGSRSFKERFKNMKKSDKNDESADLFNPLDDTYSRPESMYDDEMRERAPRRRPNGMNDDEMRESAPRRRPEGMKGDEMRERAPRRRPESMYDDEMRERAPRRRPEEMHGDEMRERAPRRRPEGMHGDEMRERAPRRRPEGMHGDEMRERAPRRHPEGMHGDEMRERAPRRRPEGMNGDEMRERAPRRRPEVMNGDEMRERAPRRRREIEMTDEEKYLMEERRRRNPNYDEERARRMRQERRRRAEGDNNSQSDLNNYYNNYMNGRNNRNN